MVYMERLRAPLCVSIFCLAAGMLYAEGQVSGASSASPLMRIATSGAGDSALPNEPFTVRSRVEEVSVRFVATDAKGAVVTGIDPGDIRVFDDQEPIGELRSFELVGRQPLRIGLVVDLSDSIRSEQLTQMIKAVDLLASVFDAKRDKAFLVGFSNQARLIQGATGDIASIQQSLRQNPGKQGLTSLYDALLQTCENEFPVEGASHEQRIMLLFSDGQDTLSMHGMDDAWKAALRAKVTIYALTAASTQSDGYSTLRTLTGKTGGRVFSLQKKHDLDQAVAGMTRAVEDEYAITFRPATGRVGFHAVRLELPDHKELKVQVTSGYFLDQK
jgi:Ca-activated chloride channel homolog